MTKRIRKIEKGERFGGRVVLGDAGFVRGTQRVRVRCDCGKVGAVLATALLAGKSRQCASCGARAAARARHDALTNARAEVVRLELDNALLAARVAQLKGYLPRKVCRGCADGCEACGRAS